jgi:hypothetical protein
MIAPVGIARAADDDEDNSGGNGFTDNIGAGIVNAVGGVKKVFGLGKPPAPPVNESPSGCPEIEVLDGTGAQRVMANADAGNLGVKYQYAISDVGRECHVANNQMVLKVGVTGRVLLGPAGAPGGFDVPIRIAVVDQLDQKPAFSKLYKVAASIPQGRTATPYALVADSVVIPFSAGKTASSYSIKIGIDTGKADSGKPKAKVASETPKPEASSADTPATPTRHHRHRGAATAADASQ